MNLVIMRSVSNRKVQGSSLIEVIVAMVISSIVILFTLVIIFNIFSYSHALSSTHYQFMAERIMHSLKTESKDPKSLIVDREGVFFEYQLEPYGGLADLYYIEVRVFDSDSIEKGLARCLFRNSGSKREELITIK